MFAFACKGSGQRKVNGLALSLEEHTQKQVNKDTEKLFKFSSAIYKTKELKKYTNKHFFMQKIQTEKKNKVLTFKKWGKKLVFTIAHRFGCRLP